MVDPLGLNVIQYAMSRGTSVFRPLSVPLKFSKSCSR